METHMFVVLIGHVLKHVVACISLTLQSYILAHVLSYYYCRLCIVEILP